MYDGMGVLEMDRRRTVYMGNAAVEVSLHHCYVLPRLMTEDDKVKTKQKKIPNNSYGTVKWISTATSMQCDKGGYQICTIHVTASRK